MIKSKRIISLMLTLVMIFSMVPLEAFAASEDGLCEHHTEHVGCGYVPAAAGSPCTHQHDETCYADVAACLHEHVDCGYVAAVPGTPCQHVCDGSCGYSEGSAEVPCACVPGEDGSLVHADGCGYVAAVPGTPCQHVCDGTCGYSEGSAEVPCGHVCSADTGCVTSQLSCSHAHDQLCGYTPAVEGAACAFECADCVAEAEPTPTPEVEPTETPAPTEAPAEQLISAWTWVDPEAYLVDGELALPGTNANILAFYEDIVSMLPAAVSTEYGELAVAWSCESYPAEGAYEGEYIFTAALPEGYALAEGAAALSVKVILGGADTLEEPVGVTIDSSNFPSTSLLNKVMALDKDDDNMLSEAEAATLVELNLDQTGCTSLEGIEYFPNLKSISCNSGNFSSVDLSGNPGLENLNLYACRSLNSINFGTNCGLYTINLEYCSFTELDLSPCTQLVTAKVGSQQNADITHCLARLDVSGCINLQELNCSWSALSSLDVSSNSNLKILSAAAGQLTELKLGTNDNLIEVNVGTNKLSYLDLSGCPNLKTLWITGNCFPSIDVNNADEVYTRGEGGGQTVNTDVPVYRSGSNYKINLADIAGEKFVSLLYSQNDYQGYLYDESTGFYTMPASAVTDGYASFEYVQRIKYVTGLNGVLIVNVIAPVGDGVWLDEESFPDAAFRSAVSAFDTDSDGILTGAEIAAVTEINVSNMAIATLEGIGYFTELITLDCSGNYLRALDLSANTKLTNLKADGQSTYAEAFLGDNGKMQLEMLPIVGAANKNKVSVEGNSSYDSTSGYLSFDDKGESYDIVAYKFDTGASAAADKYLYVDVNVTCLRGVELNEINFPDPEFREYISTTFANGSDIMNYSQAAAVTSINVDAKNISNLKGIEFFTKLTELNCTWANVSSLDVSKNTALTTLYCASNKLTELDLRNNTELKYLDCGNNMLTQLNVSRCSKLVSLMCDSNAIGFLNVSNCPNLRVFSCSGNQLTSLDVRGNSLLEELHCSDNQINSLDLSGNTALVTLDCSDNALFTLDLRANTSLKNITADQQKYDQSYSPAGVSLMADCSGDVPVLNLASLVGAENLANISDVAIHDNYSYNPETAISYSPESGIISFSLTYPNETIPVTYKYATGGGEITVMMTVSVYTCKHENLDHYEANYTPCYGGYATDYYWCWECNGVFTDKSCTQAAEYKQPIFSGCEYVFTKANYISCCGGFKTDVYMCIHCGAGLKNLDTYEAAFPAKPSTSHKLTKHSANYTACGGGMENDFYVCSICNNAFADSTGKTPAIYTEGTEQHKLTGPYSPQQAFECCSGITVPFYLCNYCDGIFLDRNGTPVPNENIVEAAKPHTYTTVPLLAVPATEQATGLKATTVKQCNYCKNYLINGELVSEEEMLAWREETQIAYFKASSVELYYVWNHDDVDISRNLNGLTEDIELTRYYNEDDNCYRINLRADVLPGTALNKVTWKSSNTGIAAVDADGVVTFKKPGLVTITATATDGSKKAASVKFNVTYHGLGADKLTAQLQSHLNGYKLTPYWYNGPDPESWLRQPESVAGLQVGFSGRVYVYGTDKTNAVANGNPDLFTYTSSNENVAKVESHTVNSPLGGTMEVPVITGVAPGETTITASFVGDPMNRSASFKLKVVPVKVDRIELYYNTDDNALASVLLNDQTEQIELVNTQNVELKARVFPEEILPDAKVTWKSSDAKIATVDADGVVTFKKPGLVTITATATDGSKKAASVKFNVTYHGLGASDKLSARLNDEMGHYIFDESKKNDEYIREYRTSFGLQVGFSSRVNVYGSGKLIENGNTALYEFTSSNPAVAKVDPQNCIIPELSENPVYIPGIITGVAPGTATITVKLLGDPLNRSCKFTVKVVAQQTLADSVTLTAAGLPDNENVTLKGAELNVKKGQASFSFTLTPSALTSSEAPAELAKGKYTWVSSDTKVATVKENADGTATVTVKGSVDGACTITTTSKDLAKVPGYFSIHVMDHAPRLGATSVTLDTSKGSSVTIPLVESYGNAINYVQYVDANNQPITWWDMVEGVPVEKDSFKADYNEPSHEEEELRDTVTITPTTYTANSTIKGKLRVSTNEGDFYLPLNIVVKNTMPSISTKQSSGKFNLFYLDSKAVIDVTVKNEQIESLWVESDYFESDKYAGGNSVTVRYKSDLPDNKPNTKISIMVKLAGYDHAIEKVVTLSTEKKGPSLSLPQTSGTINVSNAGAELVFPVWSKTANEYLPLSNGNYEASISPAFADVALINQNGYHYICLTGNANTAAFKGGKVSVSVRDTKNWLEPITLSYTVKFSESLPTLKPTSATLTLNGVFPSAVAITDYSLSQANMYPGNIMPAYLSPVKEGTAADLITVAIDGGEIYARFKHSGIDPNVDSDLIPANGSYVYSFIPQYVYDVVDGEPQTISLPEVKVTIKVVRSTPTAKLEKSSLTLNSALPSQHAEIRLVPTDKVVPKDSFGSSYWISSFDYPTSLEGKIDFTFDEEDGTLAGVYIKDPVNPPAVGSYKITAWPVCTIWEYDFSVEDFKDNYYSLILKPLTFTLKIENKVPAGKLSKTTVTLNAAVPNLTADTVISCTDANYKLLNVDTNRSKENDADEKIVFAGKANQKADAEKIAFSYNADGTITASFAKDKNGVYMIPAAGSYKFNIVATTQHNDLLDKVDMKAVSLTVKVDNKQPTVKLSKTSVSVNKVFADEKQTVELVLTDGYSISGIDVKASGKTAGLASIPKVIVKDGKLEISSNGVVKGDYTYAINVTLNYNGDTSIALPTKEMTLKVKVVDTQPKVTLSTTTLNLNTSLAGQELGSVSFDVPGYTVVGFKALGTTATGTAKVQADKIDLSANKKNEQGLYKSNTVLFSLKDDGNLPNPGSYKFSFVPVVRCDDSSTDVELNAVTFTVKVNKAAAPSATVSASGKLDMVQRDSSAITYTLTKLSNVVGKVESVELVGDNAYMFQLVSEEPVLNAKGQPTVQLKLLEGEGYSAKTTYKVKLRFNVESTISDGNSGTEPVYIPVDTGVLSVKVVNTAIKLKAPAAQTIYQSQSSTRALIYKVELTSPVGAAIDMDAVKADVSAQLQRALVANGVTFALDDEGKILTVRVLVKDTSALNAGKSYTLPILVKAKGCDSVNTKDVKVNLSIKVAK